MTENETIKIIGNIPIDGKDKCYSIEQYQEAKTAAIEALEEVKRWRTSVVNPRIKNVFANRSTQICQNCDHKDEYIEELEAEIEQYQKSGTPKECQTAMDV